VKVVGLTATPFTKGLGKTYSNVVSSVTTKQLVEAGRLAPLRVFIAKEIDMTGAKKVGGEWSGDEVTARGLKITGDIVSEWGDPNPATCEVDGCDHALRTPGCALDDRARWIAANPAVGRRITEDSLVAFRQALPPEEFAREFLGWWDEPAASDEDLTADEWMAIESDAAPSGELSLAVDVGPNQVWSSIVACGNGVLEVIERRRGASWLTDRMVELAARHPVAEFGLDPAGPVGALLPEFEREGLPIHLLDGKDTVRACGALVAGIADKTLSHRGEPELLAAIGGASRRAVGDGWKWSRKDSTVDISPLVAATYAHWLWLSREGAPISPEIYFV
jgi:hypothetical protein